MPDMKVILELIAKSDKFQAGVRQGEQALHPPAGQTAADFAASPG